MHSRLQARRPGKTLASARRHGVVSEDAAFDARRTASVKPTPRFSTDAVRSLAVAGRARVSERLGRHARPAAAAPRRALRACRTAPGQGAIGADLESPARLRRRGSCRARSATDILRAACWPANDYRLSSQRMRKAEQAEHCCGSCSPLPGAAPSRTVGSPVLPRVGRTATVQRPIRTNRSSEKRNGELASGVL